MPKAMNKPQSGNKFKHVWFEFLFELCDQHDNSGFNHVTK